MRRCSREWLWCDSLESVNSPGLTRPLSSTDALVSGWTACGSNLLSTACGSNLVNTACGPKGSRPRPQTFAPIVLSFFCSGESCVLCGIGGGALVPSEGALVLGGGGINGGE